jgi:hypothetical protein
MRKLALMLALLPASANAHDDIREAADMTLKTCIASVHPTFRTLIAQYLWGVAPGGGLVPWTVDGGGY